VVAGLRYELAIPLPEDDREAAALLQLALAAVLAAALLCVIPVLFWRQEVAALLNMPALASSLVLLPLGVLAAGCYTVLNFWAIRHQAFTPVARTRLGQAIAAAGFQLAGAPLGAAALAIGQVLGHGAGIASLGLRVLRPHWPAGGARIHDMLRMARRHRRFPLYATWGALFNTAGMHLPPILFAVFFSPAAAGIYTLANRVLSLPVQLLGQSIASVFFAGAAQAHRAGRLGMLAARVHRQLAHIGMPPMLVLMCAGPEIFAQVFGESWREAGVFARWMAPWLYLVFVTSPITSLVDVLERQAAGMAYQALLLAVRVAAILAGAALGEVRSAVILFALGSAVCWLAYLIWLFRVAGSGWSAIWRPTLAALAWAALLASPVVLGMWAVPGLTMWAASLAIAAMLIGGRTLYLMKADWA
jgi:O-antigen/teichoic acid export membrane protein